MGKETSQRLGIEGVHEIKEWLEATTRFAFTYTVYDSEPMCTLTCLDSTTKTLDLEGNTVPTPDRPARPVSVESKKYKTPGDQGNEFRRFLAIAYSSTAHAIKHRGGDWQREYMWVTFHPFSQKLWKDLHSISFMRKCLDEHVDLLDGEAIEEDLLAEVAARTWVIVVGQRQVDIRLSKEELAAVNLAMVIGGHKS